MHSKYLKENGEEVDLPEEPGQQVGADMPLGRVKVGLSRHPARFRPCSRPALDFRAAGVGQRHPATAYRGGRAPCGSRHAALAAGPMEARLAATGPDICIVVSAASRLTYCSFGGGVGWGGCGWVGVRVGGAWIGCWAQSHSEMFALFCITVRLRFRVVRSLGCWRTPFDALPAAARRPTPPLTSFLTARRYR